MLNLIRRGQSQPLHELLSIVDLPVSIPVLVVLSRLDCAQVLTEVKSLDCVDVSDLDGMLFVTRHSGECVVVSPNNDTDDWVYSQVVRILSNPVTVKGYNICINGTGCKCKSVHVNPIHTKFTKPELGICSYLNLCTKPGCKFLHFPQNVLMHGTHDTPIHTAQDTQWMCCDIRSVGLSSIFYGLIGSIMIDPPWDIHMSLNYGTMTDDEMRNLDLGGIHDNTEENSGFIYIWATSRTIDTARHCLLLWGYTPVDDIVWIKTNQIGGTVRSGRTGHWLNHSKEHCLVGVKGWTSTANFGHFRKCCDVIISPVGESSKKPNEIYDIIESVQPCFNNKVNLELFGRSHNRRPGWITLGNQLDGTHIVHPTVVQRLHALSTQQFSRD